jgi:uncharacterized repeat protein (TIGR01451 family)
MFKNTFGILAKGFLGAALLLVPALVRPAGPPSPGESVLLIYSSVTPYGVSLKDTFKNALLAAVPPAVITEVAVGAGDIGIYTQLVAQTGQTSLSNWCQVYDLRFREDRNNIAYTGPNQNDVITFAGANNDTTLFTNYLNANGHLFLQGEHHDFYIRDQNLFAFINAVAASPVNTAIAAQQYAGYNSMNTGAIGGFPAWNGFNTNWNNISAGIINAGFPGGMEMGYAGSGHPIGAFFTSQYNSSGANQCNTAYAWFPADLRTNGRMVVNFETNAFQNPGAGSVATEWIQNTYQLLSGCYRYSLTKAFVPTTLNVGDSGTFTLCYTNSGSTSLTNVPLWDTIPACLTYNSNSTNIVGAPTINGQVYSWVVPSIAPAASACVTVNFTVSSFAACP